MLQKIFKYLSLLLLLTFVGCSYARLTDLPPSYQDVEFDKLSSNSLDEDPHLWTFKGGEQYFFTVTKEEGKHLLEAVQKALIVMGYEIISVDKQKQYVWGHRTARMNEWESLFGVYYRYHGNNIDIYVQSRITQDFTGGWLEHRSKKLSLKIMKKLIKMNKEI